MNRLFLTIFFSLISISTLFALSENKKIEMLLDYVENSKNIVFIRNGSEYSGKRARKHLQKKWDYLEDEIDTAWKFIQYCATGSSMSKKPYFIKFKNGSTSTSASWLGKKLKQIEKDEKLRLEREKKRELKREKKGKKQGKFEKRKGRKKQKDLKKKE